MRSIQDIKTLLDRPKTGTIETAAAQAWRIIDRTVPDIKRVVVRRNTDDVMRSMLATDLNGYAQYDAPRLRKVMDYGNRMLDQVAAQDGVLTLSFDELDTEEGCKRLFEHCLPYPFDSGWWEYMKALNVQVDVPSVIRLYHENKTEIDGFKKILWRELRQMARDGAARH